MDSVAFQFRCDFKDYAMRTRLLTASAQRLTQLALERKIAGVPTLCLCLCLCLCLRHPPSTLGVVCALSWVAE